MSTDQQTTQETGSLPVGTRVHITEDSVSDDRFMNLLAARPGVAFTIFSHHVGSLDGRAYYMLDLPGLTSDGRYWAYAEFVEVYPDTFEVDEAKTWTVTLTGADLGWMGQHFHENADGLTHAGVHDKPRVIKALAAVLDEAQRRTATEQAS